MLAVIAIVIFVRLKPVFHCCNCQAMLRAFDEIRRTIPRDPHWPATRWHERAWTITPDITADSQTNSFQASSGGDDGDGDGDGGGEYDGGDIDGEGDDGDGDDRHHHDEGHDHDFG